MVINEAIRVIKTFLYKIIYGERIYFKGFPKYIGHQRQFNITDGNMIVGKYVSLKETAYFAVLEGGKLTIGDNVSVNRNCMIICHDSITIGDRCAIGPMTVIYDHDHKFGSEGLEHGFRTSPVVIGPNCWIGANVTILRGTVIGEGCVIGAGTVVKGNIPPHSLVTSSRKMEIRPLDKP